MRPRLIESAPPPGLSVIVTIPCYDEPELESTLRSLAACEVPSGGVEVLVFFNAPDNTPAERRELCRAQYSAAVRVAEELCRVGFVVFCFADFEIPAREAGVGTARKILMDEALDRFDRLGNPFGCIAALDGDATVSSNYLVELQRFFARGMNLATLHFEHPVYAGQGSEILRRAAVNYELYLRYYRKALADTGFPYPVFTVGSSMAVSAQAYMRAGGMNRRQAGEDFYFLHKTVVLGGFGEISQALVYPAIRLSDRVPFGTGAALRTMTAPDAPEYRVYNPQAFSDLKRFFEMIGQSVDLELDSVVLLFDSLPESVQFFLGHETFVLKMKEIRLNTSTPESFVKRFFAWFNAFQVVKFLNFSHERMFHRISVREAALSVCGGGMPDDADEYGLLIWFREQDRRAGRASE